MPSSKRVQLLAGQSVFAGMGAAALLSGEADSLVVQGEGL